MKESGIDGFDELNKALDNVPVKLLLNAVRIIDINSRLMQSHIRTEHLTGGTTETRLRVRSGRLRGSVIPLKTEVKSDRVEGGVSIGTTYGRVHFGPKGQKTKIVPKKGKYLTIPLPAAMTRAGVAKGGAKSGQWGDTFIAKSKAGNLIIFGKRRIMKDKKEGELRGQVVPLFVLKKSVTVPARVHPQDILNWIAPKMMEDFKNKGLEMKK